MRLLYSTSILVLVLFISCQPNHPAPNPPSSKEPYGIIYSAGRQKITAFDIAQEKTIWQTNLPTVLDANTTIYDNGTLYSNTSVGVVAIDASDGHIKWQQNKPGGITVAGGMPVLKDTFLYSIAGSVFSNPKPSLFCISARTGIVIWQKPVQWGDANLPATGSPVVVGDKVIGVGHGESTTAPNNSIYCFNRFDGTLIWYDGTTVFSRIKPFPFSPDNVQVIFPAGIVGNANDGLWSLDVNTGALLWHDPAILVSAGLATIFKDNQINLVNSKQTATFNLSSKKVENFVTDTISRATTFENKIFIRKYDYGSSLKCRDISSGKTIWETPSPYYQVWDTTTNISNSYTSSLVADEEYVYFREYIFNGPNPSPDNSLFIYNSSNGELVKEIKLKDSEHPINKTFFLVKDGKPYYTDMR